MSLSIFFFNDTATTEIYTLSLHDALPIYGSDFEPYLLGAVAGALLLAASAILFRTLFRPGLAAKERESAVLDRKSTRLNSSHANISYAVFCLKKNKLLGVQEVQ